MKRWRAAAIVAAVATSVAVLEAAANLDVKVVTVDGRVLTSVLSGAVWTTEVRELLQTGGYPLTFTYEIELCRPVTLWWDKVLARASVVRAARLDTLTGAYTVTRQRDGSMLRSDRMTQENEVRDSLTVVDQIQLEPESPLRVNNEYYVSVRLFITPRKDFSIWSMLPGGDENASGRKDFPFIR